MSCQGVTAAGTVQDSHLIPFSSLTLSSGREPQHVQLLGAKVHHFSERHKGNGNIFTKTINPHDFLIAQEKRLYQPSKTGKPRHEYDLFLDGDEHQVLIGGMAAKGPEQDQQRQGCAGYR